MIKRNKQPNKSFYNMYQEAPKGSHFFVGSDYYRVQGNALMHWSAPLGDWIMVLHSKPKEGYVLNPNDYDMVVDMGVKVINHPNSV